MKAAKLFGFNWLLVVLLANGLPAQAEPNGSLQLTDRLAVAAPEVLRSGQCVRYQEGGRGFLGQESGFWLEGEVLDLSYEYRNLENCPKNLALGREPLSRELFLQQEAQLPCRMGEAELAPRMEVTKANIKVQRWETPWDKRWGSNGRLYRGKYLDRQLISGGTLELNAALLTPCKAAP